MNKHEILNVIRAYQFYAVDLNLYLDNYPDNEEAKKDYGIISKKLVSLIMQYNERYGPLINFGMSIVDDDDYSRWADEKWPWERQ